MGYTFKYQLIIFVLSHIWPPKVTFKTLCPLSYLMNRKEGPFILRLELSDQGQGCVESKSWPCMLKGTTGLKVRSVHKAGACTDLAP